MRIHTRRQALRATGLTLLLGSGSWFCAQSACAATTQKRYYAHDAAEDKYGVIAPWYRGQNGQCDFRVRVAAETLKRYPWTDTATAPVAVPHYVFNGLWRVSPDGGISIPSLSDWANGDLGQRAAYVLSGLVDYYRYSGDPTAVAHISLLADALLDHCQTGPDHPWPGFLISVPCRGKPYGRCDPSGFIQLDVVAEVGLPLLRAYQMTGNRRWFDAAKHWADLLAEKRNREPGAAPWSRYANPKDVPWGDKMTGGVAYLLYFFDELIRLGYTGDDNRIVQARDAARAYLRDVLLPAWTVNDNWGRNYWDNEAAYQCETTTDFVVRYLVDNKHEFPNWRNDVRNILSLFLNHTSVNPASNGEIYSGAWAFPESSGCCGRSLWYAPMEMAMCFAQYGVEADSEWGRELARRMQILATYDCHETGVSEDNIDGGNIVCADWFKIAHPMALKHVLGTMAWLPEWLGANRENHIMRSTSVVTTVIYGKGKITYSTFDAPANTIEVLRLAFVPASVSGNGKPLPLRRDLHGNGYAVKRLANGDCIVSIRHDGATRVLVTGDDPQEVVDDDGLGYEGAWHLERHAADFEGGVRIARDRGAAAAFEFTGNQVRLIGRVDEHGGLADVYLDGEKQLASIDCWNPTARHQQVLYYRNGLANGEHTLRIVAQGDGNPCSGGANIYVDAVQWSSATGSAGSGEGGGDTGAQRMIFGYTGREDYLDSAGHRWRPATEFVARLGFMADSVATVWWSDPIRGPIANTKDPTLYRYGVHAPEIIVNMTVGPGKYHARLKFAASRDMDPQRNCVTISINGREVVSRMDVAATAGGPDRAVDLVFNDLTPRNGVIELRFVGGDPANGACADAFVQALEVGPGKGGKGATPVRAAGLPPRPECAGVDRDNLLANPGFELGAVGALGHSGATGGGLGWTYVFISPSQSYIWPESEYAIHPDWGVPEIHCGCQAIRTHSDSNGHTMIYQDVDVAPNTHYLASVWVRAVDLRGRGFGTQPGDSAALWLQELDGEGKVVHDQGRVEVNTAGPYRQLLKRFRTGANAQEVRFMLDTVIACPYTEGHVTYDACKLVRVPAQE